MKTIIDHYCSLTRQRIFRPELRSPEHKQYSAQNGQKHEQQQQNNNIKHGPDRNQKHQIQREGKVGQKLEKVACSSLLKGKKMMDFSFFMFFSTDFLSYNPNFYSEIWLFFIGDLRNGFFLLSLFCSALTLTSRMSEWCSFCILGPRTLTVSATRHGHVSMSLVNNIKRFTVAILKVNNMTELIRVLQVFCIIFFQKLHVRAPAHVWGTLGKNGHNLWALSGDERARKRRPPTNPPTLH